ncbi:hypothetical protein BGZ74_008891, partial [Mortierella antarctica]
MPPPMTPFDMSVQERMEKAHQAQQLVNNMLANAGKSSQMPPPPPPPSLYGTMPPPTNYMGLDNIAPPPPADPRLTTPVAPLSRGPPPPPPMPPMPVSAPLASPIALASDTKSSTESQVQQLLQLLTQVQEQSRAASSMNAGSSSSLPTGVLSLVPHLNQLSQVVQQHQQHLQQQHQQQTQVQSGMQEYGASVQNPGALMPPPRTPFVPGVQIPVPGNYHSGANAYQQGGYTENGENSSSSKPPRAPLPPQHDTALSALDLSQKQRSYMTSLEKQSNGDGMEAYERGSSSGAPFGSRKEHYSGDHYHQQGSRDFSEPFQKRVKQDFQDSEHQYSKYSG